MTAHDGFTLADLVAYEEKHNEANGEDNRDGESHNRSWNCGVEGPTDDPTVLVLRGRQQRNILATLLLSQGTPMLAHGDEMGRTQNGNNNVYCQDSPLSWMDWSLTRTHSDLLAFARRASALRAAHPVFRRRRFLAGRPVRDEHRPDIAWLTPTGREMTTEDWDSGFGKVLAVYLGGDAIPEPDHRGRRVVDDSFLLFFNAHDADVEFAVPSGPEESRWVGELDTCSPTGATDLVAHAGDTLTVPSRSLLVLRRTGRHETDHRDVPTATAR